MLASAGYSFRVPVSKSTFSVWDILCSPVQWSIRRCMRIRRRTERFLRALSEELGIDQSELVQPENEKGERWVHPYVAINFAQWAGGELAVQTIKWVLQWFRDKVYETTEKEESFEDVDPKFTAWIQKAAKFDPRKLKKTSE